MEAINMVDSGNELREEFNQDKLFKSDVKSVVQSCPHTYPTWVLLVVERQQ